MNKIKRRRILISWEDGYRVEVLGFDAWACACAEALAHLVPAKPSPMQLRCALMHMSLPIDILAARLMQLPLEHQL